MYKIAAELQNEKAPGDDDKQVEHEGRERIAEPQRLDVFHPIRAFPASPPVFVILFSLHFDASFFSASSLHSSSFWFLYSPFLTVSAIIFCERRCTVFFRPCFHHNTSSLAVTSLRPFDPSTLRRSELLLSIEDCLQLSAGNIVSPGHHLQSTNNAVRGR